MKAGRYDAAQRRRSVRRGRERGCWVYVPAEELQRAGIDLDGPPPFYKVWGRRGGGLAARFYREA